jgi:hypothetical protein
MKSSVLASLAFASFIVISDAGAQTRPDLSGSWRLDPNRSDSATYPELTRPVTLVITQTASELRVETQTARGTTTEVAQFRTDDNGPAAGMASARWRSNNTLVIDAVRDIRGQSVTVQQAMMLSPTGNELTIESTVNVQHGYSLSRGKVYGAGRDVFVRTAQK